MLGYFSLHSAAATELRCGNDLVGRGDFKAEVLLKCGEPFLKDRYYQSHSGSSECEVVDQWTYESGPGSFFKIVEFERGVVVRILTGGRVTP